MRSVARLCATIPIFVAACAPKGETAVNDSAATAAPPVVDVAAVKQTIDQTNAKMADALQRADTAVMKTIYDSDAMVMLSEQPAWRGGSEIAAGGAAFFQQVSLSGVKFTTGTVDVAGDYAIETGTYEMTATPKGGKATPDKGKYITVWKKQPDGSWKVYRDISNTDIASKR